MAQDNGGTVGVEDEDWELYPIADGSDRKRISRTANHIFRETALWAQTAGWPPGALAIASDGMGNALIFLKIQGEYRDKIYRWDHETGHSVEVAAKFGDIERL